jgi:HD superfamily phosphohydrolase
VQANETRIYHDPLHGAITLHHSDPVEQLLIQLIDTPPFQRLRRIRQLGPASLTFHGAEASRFTHSLGVMEITRRAFDGLAQRYPELQPHRATALCAALLHDIGHGPFSHTGEDIFGSHHEHWTGRILRESPEIAELLQAWDQALTDAIISVYHHHHPIPLIWQLVSSQLDCDRLDYLMRDSYFTGASYGRLDLDRILAALRYDRNRQELVVAHKAQGAIEHYLVVRSFMYAQVYNHRKNLAAAWGLKQVFLRAQQLINQTTDPGLFLDPILEAWLGQDCNQLPLATYLAADDGVLLYHLHQWRQGFDPILGDLSRRYLDRDLLKACNVSYLPQSQQEAFLTNVQQQLAHQGYDPQYYVGLQQAHSRGYTLYHQGIQIQTEQGYQDISAISPLIQALIQDQNQTWLIYPRQVEDFIVAQVSGVQVSGV